MATGYLDKGEPFIDIEVSNPLGWKSKLKCLIDTGFSGFLSIPILQAFPIGLILHTTSSVTLADGSTSNKLTCLGQAELDGESKVGLILIEPASDQVLLGMEFLRKFSKRLIVDPILGTVELITVAPPPPTTVPATPAPTATSPIASAPTPPLPPAD